LVSCANAIRHKPLLKPAVPEVPLHELVPNAKRQVLERIAVLRGLGVPSVVVYRLLLALQASSSAPIKRHTKYSGQKAG